MAPTLRPVVLRGLLVAVAIASAFLQFYLSWSALPQAQDGEMLAIEHVLRTFTARPFLPVEQYGNRTGPASAVTSYPLPTVEISSLPLWIQKYIAWHTDMRQQFPGNRLFSDPRAPKLLIRTCSTNEKCGGLNDRLGKLPWDLYLANQTQRLLLFNWCKPCALENFLLPNKLDWSIPRESELFFGANCSQKVDHIKDLFKGLKASRPDADFWEKGLQKGLQRAVHGRFAALRVLKFHILGNELRLAERLRLIGETDMLDWTTPTYGKLFWLFFKPSPGLQKELDQVYTDLQLVPNEYSAAHCRVRHPKSTPSSGKFVLAAKEGRPGGPDRVGLSWEGDSRKYAIQTATRALQCLATFPQAANKPVYFYSDSEDLVQFMANDITDPNFSSNSSLTDVSDVIPVSSAQVEAAARKAASATTVVARRIDSETLHIDRQTGHAPLAYYASFVDLLVAARAQCVAVGVGNFAVFASKLSGDHSCLVEYRKESWGDTGAKEYITTQCELNEL